MYNNRVYRRDRCVTAPMSHPDLICATTMVVVGLQRVVLARPFPSTPFTVEPLTLAAAAAAAM